MVFNDINYAYAARMLVKSPGFSLVDALPLRRQESEQIPLQIGSPATATVLGAVAFAAQLHPRAPGHPHRPAHRFEDGLAERLRHTSC